MRAGRADPDGATCAGIAGVRADDGLRGRDDARSGRLDPGNRVTLTSLKRVTAVLLLSVGGVAAGPVAKETVPEPAQGAKPAAPAGLGVKEPAAAPQDSTAVRPRTSRRGSESEAYYQYLLAKLRRYNGDLNGAADHLSRAAGADDSSAIHAELAETYLRMGDLSKAVEEALLATEKDPTDIAAHKALMSAYLAQAQRGPDPSRAAAAAMSEIRTIIDLSPDDIDMRITLGRLLLQDNRPKEALEQFRAAREAGGDAQRLGMMIAQSLAGDGRTNEAEAELQGILAVSPGNYDALMALAQMAEEREDWVTAAGFYQRMIEVRLGDNEVRGRLGFALLKAGRTDEAITVLREACAAAPQDRKLREMLIRALRGANRPGDALHELDLLLEYRPNDPSLLMQIGRLHEERAEAELALESYRRASSAAESLPVGAPTALDANSSGALALSRASLELETGDPAAAIRTLSKIPDNGSDLGLEAVALRIRALSASGQGPEAIRTAQKLIQKKPDEPRAALLLLEARLVGSSREKAVQAIEEYRPVSRSPRELVSAADILRRAGQGALGLELLEKTVDAHPQDATLLFSLAALQGQLGASRKADALMEKVLELDPNESRAQNYLGYSLAESGKDLARAEALIRKALEAEPASAAYIDSLGWVLYKQDRLEEAEKQLLRAADLMAGDATVREHLGDLYMKKGDVQRAIAEWKTAQGLRPEDPARLRRKILEATRTPR